MQYHEVTQNETNGKEVEDVIQIHELRGEIARKGYSQSDVAKMLGMSPKTFYGKMRRGVFGSDEICQLIEILEIKNPIEIFFAPKVTQ